MDCYALPRKEGFRPYDLLVVFRRTLAVGSTRIKIYDNMIAQAQRDSRLKFQAQAAYDEILAKMKSVLRESKLTKQTRIEMEFNQLEMGRLITPLGLLNGVGTDADCHGRCGDSLA